MIFQRYVKLSAWMFVICFAFGITSSNFAHALNEAPRSFTLDGRIFSSPTSSTPLLGSVTINVKILDPTATCVLYEEAQPFDTTTTNGYFNIAVGSSVADPKRVGDDPNHTMETVYQNKSVISAVNAGCGAGFTPAAGDTRLVRITVTPTLTGIAQVFSPDMRLDAVPTAVVAESIQGLSRDNMLELNTNIELTQANIENVFSVANYPVLTSLLAGTSSLYMKAAPTSSVSFNGQQITNVAAPTLGTDAANKSYADGYIGGKAADGVVLGAIAAGDAGKVMVWDGAKWTAAAPAGDATKLPLAGGTMTGAINMGSQNLLATGHVTMSSQTTLNLGTYTNGQEAVLVLGLGAPDKGKFWYNTDLPGLKVWDGGVAVAVQQSGSAAGGDLSGTYPNPSIAANAVVAAKINDGAVTSAKILDGTIVGSDIANSTVSDANISGVGAGKITSGAGVYLTYAPNGAACADGEYMRWDNTNARWVCGVPTDTGITTLTGDISASGSGSVAASIVAGAVVTAKIADGNVTDVKIADVSYSKLTNASGVYLNYLPNNVACADGQILSWDNANSRWVCAADADTGMTALTGDVTGTGSGSVATTIANNAIVAAKLNDDAVTTSKILNAAVTDAKINDVAVSKITSAAGQYFGYLPNGTACADGQVLSWDNANSRWVCASGAVGSVTSVATGTGLTGGTITTTGTISIAAGGVSATELAADAVTSAKILDGTIALADLAADSVDSSKIVDGTIVTADLADNAVTANKINALAVTTPKMFAVPGANYIVMTDGVSGNTLVAKSCAATEVLKWTVTGWACAPDDNSGGTVTEIATGTGLAGGPITGVGTVSIAAGGVSSTELASNAVVASKINDGAVTSTGILDGAILASDLNSSIANGLWSVNGSDVYRSSGNVGIGTTAPASSLHVYGPGVLIQNSTANNTLSSMTSAQLGNPQVTIVNRAASGHMGGLHVYQGGKNSGSFLSSGGESTGFWSAGAVYDHSGPEFRPTETTASALSQSNGVLTYSANSGLTVGTPVPLTELFRINSNGNVGIGTTAPGALLDLDSSTTSNSGINIGNNTTPNLSIRIDTNVPIIESIASNLLLKTQNTTVFDSNGGATPIGNGVPSLPRGVYITPLSTAYKGLVVRGVPSQAANIMEVEDSSQASLLSVTAAGNVGIGTSSPVSRLTIDGVTALGETTAPTNSAGYGKLYVKSADSKLYFMDDAGVEKNISDSAAGGTVTSVQTGTGLTGGGFSTTGTISIAAGGVGSTELAANAVVASKINDGAVTSTGILDGTVATIDIAAKAITTALINDSAVTALQLNADAVTSAKILDGTITGADLSSSVTDGLWSVDGTSIYRASGNVGIGTTSPDNFLTIATPGSTSTDNKSQIRLVSTRGNLGVASAEDVLGGIDFVSNDMSANTTTASVRAITIGNHATPSLPTGLTFYTYGTSAPLNERMRIDPTGKVGIGTTSPSQALEVVGNLKLTDASGSNSVMFSNPSTTVYPGLIWNDSTTGAGSFIGHNTIDNSTSYGQSWLFNAYQSGNGASQNLKRLNASYRPARLTINGHDSGLNYLTATLGAANSDITDMTSRFFVSNTSGNVGIGTTAVNSILTVAGVTALAETAAPTNTAGYGKLYVKSADSKLYFMDDAGVEKNISDSAAGGTVTSVQTGTGLTGGGFSTTGTISIAAGGVGSTELAANAVVASKINDGAVTSTGILDSTIATVDVAAKAVTTALINDSAVTALQLNADAVTSAKILDGTIATADIANKAITTALINDAAITALQLNADAVTSSSILDGAITIADLNSSITDSMWSASGGNVYRSTGNVGIGTTSPTDSLHVSQAASNSLQMPLRLQNQDATNGGSATGIGFKVESSSANASYKGGIAFERTASNGRGILHFLIDGTNDTSAVTLTDSKLAIDYAGNVGIGTTSPNAILTVAGVTSLAETSAPTNTANYGKLYVKSSDSKLYFMDDAGTETDLLSTGAASSLAASTGAVGAPSISFSGDTNTGFYNATSNDTISVAAGGANIFNISSAGIVSGTSGGGLVTTANGVVGAPTYSFAGDTDTGWWSPAADTMAASTGGAERVRINSSGNVGIGTTAPSNLMDLLNSGSGTSYPLRLQNNVAAANESAAGLMFAANRTTSGMTNVGSVQGVVTDITSGSYKGALTFSTAWNGAPTERMRLDYAGRLIVGSGSGPTTTANGFISIVDASTSQAGLLYIANTSATNANTTLIELARNDAGNNNTANDPISEVRSTGRVNSSSATISAVKTAVTDVGAATYKGLYTISVADSGALSDRFAINGSNVGIGTTAPANRLQVYDASAAQLSLSGWNPSAGAGPENGTLAIGSASSAQGRLHYDGASTGRLFLDNTFDNSEADILIRSRTSGTTVNAITIKGSGNVGIGVTVPNSLLTVGGVTSLAETAAPTNTADYGKLYVKSSDSKIYFMDDGGTEYNLTAPTGATASAGAATGSFVVNSNSDGSGGDGGFNFRANGSNLMTISNAGDVAISSTTASSSTTTGALTVAGGLGVAGGLYANTLRTSALGSVTTANVYVQAGNSDVYTSTSSSVASPPTGGGGPSVSVSNTSGTVGSGAYYKSSVNNGTNNQNVYFGAIANAGAGVYTPSFVLGQQTGATAYAERMRINASGNVGIGTSSPTTQLEVSASTSANALKGRSSSNFGLGVWGESTGADGNAGFFSSTGTNSFGVYATTANTGGIPIYAVNERSADTVENTLALWRRNGTAPGAGFGGRIDLRASGNTPTDSPSVASIAYGWEGAQTNNTTDRDGYLAFSTTLDNGSSSAGGTERVRINSSGNVGIGTTAPNRRLDITASGNGTVLNADGNAAIAITNTDTTNNNFAELAFMSNSTAPNLVTGAKVMGIFTNHAAALSADLGFMTRNAGALAENMRITGAGNVGIGTVTPGQLMHVASSTTNANVAVSASESTSAGLILQTKGQNGQLSTAGSKGWQFLAFGDASGVNQNDMTLKYVDAGSATQVMNFKNNGNVGIGTTAPNALLTVAGVTSLAETTAPTNTANFGKLYVKSSDSKLYFMDDAGTETDLLASGAASSVAASTGAVGAPSISFSGDSDTGFYNETSNNTISVAAGGANIFNFSSAGLVSPTSGGAAITTANGVVGAPTYSFAGDTDTGWWSPAANTMAASNGGTESVRIDSSGNVGIGTTSPYAKLDVVGSDNTVAGGVYASVYNTNSGANATSGYAVGNDLGDIGYLWTGSSTYDVASRSRFVLQSHISNSPGVDIVAHKATADFRVYTGGDATANERLRIQSDGNIGIGTTAPASKLAINQSGADGSAFSMTFPSSGSIDFSQWSDTQYVESNKDLVFGTNAAKALIFKTNNSQRLNITSAGNIGIGTTAPSKKLEVVAADDSTELRVINSSSTAQRSPVVQVRNYAGATSGHPSFILTNSRGNSVTTAAMTDGDRLGSILFNGMYDTVGGYSSAAQIDAEADGGTFASGDTPGRLIFKTTTDGSGSGTEKMRITNAGNVGIGTTEPATKLHVQGTIRTSEAIPTFSFYETDQASGSRFWYTGVNGKQYVLFQGRTDDGSSGGGDTLTVDRGTGNAMIALNANRNAVSFFNLDYVNGRVGIGTTAPTQMLEVTGNIKTTGAIMGGTTTDSDALSAVTIDFTNYNMIRADGASAACGTLNFTNVTAGGNYTVTIPNATATCTTIHLNGAATNVKLPSGYGSGGVACTGVVYTAIYDGTTLWVSYVPF